MEAKRAQIEIVTNRFFGDIVTTRFVVVYLLVQNVSIGDEDVDASFIDRLIVKTIEATFDKGEYNWPAIVDKSNYILESANSSISIKIDSGLNEENEKIWEITIESDFVLLEQYRALFLAKIRDLGVQVYCLKDDVSYEICRKAYPLIYKLENLLREYLLRFFLKKVGSNWWRNNSNEALKNKSKSNSESRSFHGLLLMDIYNIDFIDLRELITGNFPRLTNHDIIQSLQSIGDCKDNPDKVEEKVNKLKDNFIGNWEKFFENHIGIEDFKTTWQRLYDMRCIVSHNNLITMRKFIDLVEYYENIMPKLSGIIAQMPTRELSTQEKESIGQEEEMRSFLDHLSTLDLTLSASAVSDILDSGSIVITPEVIKLEPTEFAVFKNGIEKLVPLLDELIKVEKHHVQGEEIEVPNCWIKFKDLSNFVKQSLAYGLKTNYFT